MLKLSKLLGSSFRGFSSQAGMTTAEKNFVADGTLRKKVFAPYTIYKGKAAVSAEPCLPAFSKFPGGVKVDRKGVIMLKFFPSVGERKYDWEKKQIFALSATEVGTILNLGPNDSCEFFHDPSMQQSNAGKVRKTLSIKAHGDGNGYFMSLTVVNNLINTNDRLTVPVTGAEFSVMRSAFSFALPHILGWDQYTNPQQASIYQMPSGNVAQQLVESEWDR